MKCISAIVVGAALADSTGNPDAVAFPSMHELLCKVVEAESVEKKVVDFVCEEQAQKLGKFGLPEAECEKTLDRVWDAMATKECPNASHQLAALPPMMCKLVQNAAIEKKAVTALCSKQKKVPAAECELGLTKMWDALVKRECPSKQLAAKLQWKPMVCKLIETPTIEKEVVDKLCSKQSKVPVTECETGLSKIWEGLAAKECSTGKLTAIPPMACKLVTNQEIEHKVVGALCSRESKLPAEECEMVLTKMWDAFSKKECPSSKALALPPIKPMICKLVESASIEEKVVDMMCTKQKRIPASECEAGLSKVWDMIAARECSKTDLSAMPPIIHKVICKVVKSSELETEAVDKLCAKQSHVPAAECKMALTKLWNFFADKECPADAEVASVVV